MRNWHLIDKHSMCYYVFEEIYWIIFISPAEINKNILMRTLFSLKYIYILLMARIVGTFIHIILKLL